MAAAPGSAAVAELTDVNVVGIAPIATLTLYTKPNRVGNIVSVHRLANDFPSCCWVANDNKNISGTTFDDLGGVDRTFRLVRRKPPTQMRL